MLFADECKHQEKCARNLSKVNPLSLISRKALFTGRYNRIRFFNLGSGASLSPCWLVVTFYVAGEKDICSKNHFAILEGDCCLLLGGRKIIQICDIWIQITFCHTQIVFFYSKVCILCVSWEVIRVNCSINTALKDMCMYQKTKICLGYLYLYYPSQLLTFQCLVVIFPINNPFHHWGFFDDQIWFLKWIFFYKNLKRKGEY